LETGSLAEGLVTVATATATTTITATETASAAATTLTAVATATSAAAEAATWSTPATAETTFTGLLRAGFINLEGTAHQVLAIPALDRFLGAFRRIHRDKCETAWATRHFVHHLENFGDAATGFKRFANGCLVEIEREIANIEFGVAHDNLTFFADPRCIPDCSRLSGFKLS
jgi:hypothetical protein